MILIPIALLPLAAALLCLVAPGKRGAQLVTIAAAVMNFLLALGATGRVLGEGHLAAIPNWLTLDGFSAIILLLVTFVALTAALFSWGYIAAHDMPPERRRSYGLHFNLFVFALVLVPLMEQPAVEWIAVEFTALFGVLLVAFDNTHAALEAAWKYVSLMFMGAAAALPGFFLLFWAEQIAGGGAYSWSGLRAIAPRLPPSLLLTAFLFILVGFGMKVGFVPLHTWLPDAHSQAPSPVCALLSGVKTTTTIYVLFRLTSLFPATVVEGWMRAVGLISLGVASLLLLQVRDYKRLFAFSTVEHMGIIFLAGGLGAASGLDGAMLQIVSHSLTKSFCFLASGAALLVLGTREIAAARGLLRSSFVAGAALLIGALAIGGAPPFAVFLSEFSILRAGLGQRHYVVTVLLAVFITVAFFAILLHVSRIVFGTPAIGEPSSAQRHLPLSCRLTLGLAAIPVVWLGIYQPMALHTLLQQAVASLTPLS